MLGSCVVDRFRGVASCRQLRHGLELGESGPAGRLGAAAILKRGPAARRIEPRSGASVHGWLSTQWTCLYTQASLNMSILPHALSGDAFGHMSRNASRTGRC